MRVLVAVSVGIAALSCASIQACSSNSNQAGFDNPGGGSGSSSGGSGSGSGGSSGSSGGSGSSSGSSSGGLVGDGGGPVEDGDGGPIVTNTIYAHSDDTLYSMDPQTKAVTVIGPFMGTSDSSTDSVVTDLAVDSNDEVYVNTESVVYKAALPATPPGAVTLTKVATIQGTSKFYALAFAPQGALDPNSEVLVGGDSTGALWSINTTSGATVNLGTFGANGTGATFVLSGDIVFYNDSSNTPTGLATIRSCPTGKTNTITNCGNDFLAAVNMAALKTAYTTSTAAPSLLGGIYGATTSGGMTTGPGTGTGFGDVFGLGAWNSTVFGFTRSITTPAAAPQLITINTTTGAGTSVQSFSFTKPDTGWSGAGVTTKVTISVPPPPPPPAQ